ncbi:haloacid dehalogenase type II [Sphingobacterium sp. Mn56C]|uniref:haloacid dehalogenase type II n=1 Tax=Sphingobacterium sp. Mn56C TaxID=3395261 RepID=UPI003BDD7EA7
MEINRRNFLKDTLKLGTAGAILPASLSAFALPAAANPGEGLHILQPEGKNRFAGRPKVLFFDVNETLLDLEPLKVQVNTLLGNKDLGTLWFTSMLQYAFVTSLGRQYADFGTVGAAALEMIAANHGISLKPGDAMAVVKQIMHLEPHPDVKEGLSLLKDAGYTLVSFTNSSNYAVNQQLQHAGISSFFDRRISVQDFGRFKPDRDVYDWAARCMGVSNRESMLIAAHGWDIAGAAWAGWQSAFIARAGQQIFPLAPQPQLYENNLTALAQALTEMR